MAMPRLESEAMRRTPGDRYADRVLAEAHPAKGAARRRRSQSDGALFLLGFTALLVLAWMLFAVGGEPQRLNTAENANSPRGTAVRTPAPMHPTKP